VLRAGLSNPHLIDRLTEFKFGNHRIANFEMETAGIYGMGKLLGHHCVSLSVVVANRIHKNFSIDSATAVENLVVKTLDILTAV
jgi:uridine phosphorylase